MLYGISNFRTFTSHVQSISNHGFLRRLECVLSLWRPWRLSRWTSLPCHDPVFTGLRGLQARLVESDDVAEVLSRLAAISSREKALEPLSREPSLRLRSAVEAHRHLSIAPGARREGQSRPRGRLDHRGRALRLDCPPGEASRRVAWRWRGHRR